MTDNTQPDALRLVEQYDYGDPVAHSNKWKAAACNELRRLHAENAALQQGYDAARLEIEHLRGVTKSKLLAQPVAWMVYLPSIDTQHLYYSQEDMGYVDDVTNHADAEVSPLYEMAAPKAEVAPAGEYPAVTTEFINKHAHPSQAAKLCREDWSGKDESSVETVQPEVIKLLHAYVDADRAMRAQADSQPAPVLGTIAHVGTGKTTLTGAITSALRAASTEADNVTAPAGATSNTHWNQAPCAHCGCTEGQHFITRCHHIQGETRYTPTQQADSQPAKVWDYPPMPDFDTVEQHIYGACRRYITQDMLEPIHNLIRDVIDADRAAQQGAGRGGADVPDAAIWRGPYRGRRRVPFG